MTHPTFTRETVRDAKLRAALNALAERSDGYLAAVDIQASATDIAPGKLAQAQYLPDTSYVQINAARHGVKPGRDCTAALSSALGEAAQYPRGGARIHLPPGLIYVEGVLTPHGENQRLYGTGKRTLTGGLDPAATDVPTTLRKVGAGPLVLLDTANACGGWALEGVTLIGDPAQQSVGIEWRINGPEFRREFDLTRAALTGFWDCALKVSRVAGSAMTEIGIIRVQDCALMSNSAILRQAADTTINGFTFAHNEAGNNAPYAGQGGLLGLRANVAEIRGNVLEGQMDSLRAAYLRAFEISGNYFEHNYGRASVTVESGGSGLLGPNFYNHNASICDHKAYLANCARVLCLDPAWLEACIGIQRGHLTDTPWAGDGYVAAPAGKSIAWGDLESAERAHPVARTGAAKAAGARATQDIWPDGTPIYCNRRTITPAAAARWEGFSVSAATGDYLVVSVAVQWLARPDQVQARLYVNGAYSDANGSAIQTLYGNADIPVGRWCMLTFAVRAREPVTSLGFGFYPYGTAPSAPSADVLELNPICYACKEPSEIAPFFDRAAAMQAQV